MNFLSHVPLMFVISSSVTKSCPFYNFGTVQDMFIKRHTNIKHQKMTRRVQEPYLLNMYFLSYVPLKFVNSSSVTKSCLLYNFKTVQDIFTKLNTNINQH